MIQPVAAPVDLATPQQPPPEQPPPEQPPQPRNLPVSRKLAVAQVIIGVLANLQGILTYPLLPKNDGPWEVRSGIWAGGWYLITGCIGIRSTRNNNSLNCLYLVFNIISTCITGFSLIINGIAVAEGFGKWWYRNGAVLGLHLPFEILLVIEFFVSISASVYCCQNSDCCHCQGELLSEQVVVGQPGHNAPMVVSYSHQQQQLIQLPGGLSQQQLIQLPGGLSQQQYAPMYVIHGAQQAPSYNIQSSLHGAQQAPSYNIQSSLHGGPISNVSHTLPTVGHDQPPAYSEKP